MLKLQNLLFTLSIVTMPYLPTLFFSAYKLLMEGGDITMKLKHNRVSSNIGITFILGNNNICLYLLP